MTDWMDRPIRDIAGALRARRVTAGALLDEATERHATASDTDDGAVGPYSTWEPEFAARLAGGADHAFQAGVDLGPLQGIPISVKDLFGVSGLQTHAGSPTRLPKKWEADGRIASAIRRQFAVIVGKTHMVEFAFGGLGVNSHWGTPANPWDTKVRRVPGGSSSGAGLSLLEGSACVALGTDTAGSVRVPASLTGTVGLKVTVDRWPTDGIVPLSQTLDTPGVLARSVDDAALAFSAIDRQVRPASRAGIPAPPALSDLKIGICEGPFWDDCAPGVAEAIEVALAELEAKGATRTPFAWPEAVEALQVFSRGGLAGAEIYGFLEAELPAWLETLDPVVAARIHAGRDLPAYQYLQRRDHLARLSRAAAARLRAVHVAVLPTVTLTAPAIDDVIADADAYRAANMLALRNTTVANMLGLCALTLPVGLDDAGMPVGLQLVALPGTEERLLAIALAFEGALGRPADRLGQPPARSR